MENKVILKVENLKQYFKLDRKSKVKAVDDVSFEIYEGETFGLVGESGSGKTTIGRSIIRLYNITAGNVILLLKALIFTNYLKLKKNVMN